MNKAEDYLNNDGFVNMADVTKLIDYILGRSQ